jgi:hypothetical protein
MTDIASIINSLEDRRAAIDLALVALREVDGIAALDTTESASIGKPASTRKGRKLSAAVRKRMKEGQRLRWERIRADADKVPF